MSISQRFTFKVFEVEGQLRSISLSNSELQVQVLLQKCAERFKFMPEEAKLKLCYQDEENDWITIR